LLVTPTSQRPSPHAGESTSTALSLPPIAGRQKTVVVFVQKPAAGVVAGQQTSL